MRNRHRPFALLAFLLSHIVTYAQLTADFTMDRSNGCSPLSINFTSITNGSSASATYSWNFGNGNSSSLRNPSAIFTKEQTYTITLVVTDGSHTATSSKTLTVYKKPVVEFSVGAPKVCLPATAIFSSGSTAGDGAISSLQWDFGDGIVQQESGSTVSHSYSTEQVATVSLTVTNNFGCQASATKKDIVEILGPITPVFTANKSLLCAITDTVAFTNNSKGPGALRYSWDFGDGITSTLTNPAHRFATKAVYPVKLTVSNEVGCSAVSYPVPVNAAYFQTDFTSRPLCREVSFSPSSFVYPSSSFWKFGDGATSFSSYNPSHIYGMSGTYQVTLVNTYGACRDTVSKTVSVSETANYNSGITGPGSTCQRTYVNFTSTSNTAPGLITWDFGDGNIHNYGNYPMVSHAYSHPVPTP
jgi:PKD repeat protein